MTGAVTSHRRGCPPVLALAAVLAWVVVLITVCDLTGRFDNHPGTRPAQGKVAVHTAADSGDWRLGSVGPAHAIEGYADRVSARPGEVFRLFVSTTAPSFTVAAYRMGWYGGRQAHLVWHSPRLLGRVQAAPRRIPGLNTVTTAWQPSAMVATRGWPEGDYLLKLVSSAGFGRYIPLTIRSTSARGKVVLVNAVTTWQAYNTWGDYSLYTGPKGFADRARAVSFDRPYDGSGADQFFAYEQPLVALAEKMGLPLAYATDIELATKPQLFQGARAVIFLGHDEYWSSTMRTNATRIRDAGTNLAFLGANEIYRHIRLEPTALGADRLVVCYKSAAEDPSYSTDPHETTQSWRYPPFPQPENVLTGTYYQCNPATAPLVIYDPKAWMFAGTGVRRDSVFPGLVGSEYDRVVADPTTPHPIQVLSHSPITCRGQADYADAAYYSVASGAGVFATGTLNWVCALGTGCGKDGPDQAGRAFVTRVTENVLQVFSHGPAGRTYPARDNTAAVGVRANIDYPS